MDLGLTYVSKLEERKFLKDDLLAVEEFDKTFLSFHLLIITDISTDTARKMQNVAIISHTQHEE